MMIRVLGIAQDFQLIVKLLTLSALRVDFYIDSALAFVQTIK